MKLKDFVETPNGKTLSLAEWARRCKVTRGYFCQLRDENKSPSVEVAYRIELVTNGLVTMQDWVKDLPEFAEEQAVGGDDDTGLRGSATTSV